MYVLVKRYLEILPVRYLSKLDNVDEEKFAMYFNDFSGVKISALAAAVPDQHEKIMDYADHFPDGEIEQFCKSIGIHERYSSVGIGTTASDLCVAAAEEIFSQKNISKDSIFGIIFLTQSPDYATPATSCVIQHRLGLDNCGLVYDANIGCTAFPFGLQISCANLMAGCKRVLLLMGDSTIISLHLTKDDMLFGDCGIAVLLEKVEDTTQSIKSCVHTIGKKYQSLFAPYGMAKHPLKLFYEDRGIEDTLAHVGQAVMDGADVFTFSIKDAPRTTKEFLAHFNFNIDDYDLVSIHQANKMIVDNVAKRIKAPKEKVLWTLDRYGNTRGASTALNICDYVEQNNIHTGTKRILNLAFGIGLNIALADFELDVSGVLPIIKTTKVYDDGIDNFTHFMDDKK